MLRLIQKAIYSGFIALVLYGCSEPPVTDNATTVFTGVNGNLNTVSEPNEAPVADDLRINTNEDSAVSMNLSGNDPEGSAITYEIVTQPKQGSVSITDRTTGAFVYTPAENVYGLDSFTFKTNDGELDSAAAIVTISIALVNDAPIAVNDEEITNEDTALTINDVLANDSDVDGDAIAVASYTQPTQGKLDIQSAGFVYTPNANYSGKDSFTYTISDGKGAKATAIVHIVVQATNDNPVAVADEVSTSEDTALSIDNVLANDSDLDGDILSIVSISQGTHGTVAISAGIITYTPHANYSGTDSFTYTVDDGNGGRANGTVKVAVNSANDAPVAVNDIASTDEDKTLVIYGVLDNDTDADNDTLTITSVTQPSHGTVVKGTNGTFTYTPLADFNGEDSFQYTVGDGNGGNATGVVSVSVAPVNDRPMANQDTTTVSRDNTVVMDILANDTGLGDGPVNVSTASVPSNGTVQINADATVTYTPKTGYFGTDSFSYKLVDADGEVTIADVQIEVTCPGGCTRNLQVFWDANIEPDITGYYVYHGTESGTYTDRIWVADATSYDFSADTAGTHYFAVSAVNSSSLESPLSDQVSITF